MSPPTSTPNGRSGRTATGSSTAPGRRARRHDGRSFVLRFPNNTLLTTVFVNGVVSATGPRRPCRGRATSRRREAGERQRDRRRRQGLLLRDRPDARRPIGTAPVQPAGRAVPRRRPAADPVRRLPGHVQGPAQRHPRTADPGRRRPRVHGRRVLRPVGVAEPARPRTDRRNPDRQPPRGSSAHGPPARRRGDREDVRPGQGRDHARRGRGSRSKRPAGTNPKLWWPDDPQRYVVETTLSSRGKPTDRVRTNVRLPRVGTATATSSRSTASPGSPGRPPARRSATASPAETAVAEWRKNGQTMVRDTGATSRGSAALAGRHARLLRPRRRPRPPLRHLRWRGWPATNSSSTEPRTRPCSTTGGTSSTPR